MPDPELSPTPNTAAPLLPQATIRRSPDDFVVEEIPAYAPSGQGEHVYVTFRKTGLTTPEAAKRIARALEADPRDAGHAGMKDRHAVTTQTISIQAPISRDAAKMLAAAKLDGIDILGVSRHQNKLKPGHLHGNRFRIVLRDLDPISIPSVCDGLLRIRREGVPNAFGPQRFGRDGANPERAIAWIRGENRGPRDRQEQRLLFSALQSSWFNEVLSRRELDGSWLHVLPGDLAKKTDTGGMFLVPSEGPEASDAMTRALAGELVATGPMFGKKMRWPEGRPAEIEREVICNALGDPAKLDPWGQLGEGTRRPLKMGVAELQWTELPLEGGHAALAVSFTLPKGGYATTVLGRAAHLLDATVARSPAQSHGGPERADGDLSQPQEEDDPTG